jgi:hypothetical protein
MALRMDTNSGEIVLVTGGGRGFATPPSPGESV